MNPLDSFKNIIENALGRGEKEAAPPERPAFNPAEFESLEEIIDGMGAGTARIIIDKEASARIAEEYDVSGIENKGRYYVAKVMDTEDGHLIAELIVDKQNGKVQFLGGKTE